MARKPSPRHATATSHTSTGTGSPNARKALGLTQAQAAKRTGVTKSRISQIERGEVSTIDGDARYVQAIGGTIQISAVFGDDHYILRGTATEAA